MKDFIRPHHLVVFVLQKMTVPYIAAGITLEVNDNAGNHTRVSSHGVLPPRFGGLRRKWRTDKFHLLLGIVGKDVEWTAIKYLKSDHVKMYRMRVAGEIYEIPNLDGVEYGLLCHRHFPVKPVKEHENRLSGGIQIFA